jgi:hypothetical protein
MKKSTMQGALDKLDEKFKPKKSPRTVYVQPQRQSDGRVIYQQPRKQTN